MKTIDCTPTWVSLLPLMLQLVKSNNIDVSKPIEKEFERMAKAADLYNELINKTK